MSKKFNTEAINNFINNLVAAPKDDIVESHNLELQVLIEEGIIVEHYGEEAEILSLDGTTAKIHYT